jgi:hypothetical protein
MFSNMAKARTRQNCRKRAVQTLGKVLTVVFMDGNFQGEFSGSLAEAIGGNSTAAKRESFQSYVD